MLITPVPEIAHLKRPAAAAAMGATEAVVVERQRRDNRKPGDGDADLQRRAAART